MADILIRGMEMPTSCSKCRFGDGYACYATGKIVQDEEWENTRHSFCPLVALPEGHGRLTDGDKLKAALTAIFESFEGKVNWNDAICAVLSTPTIVPADKEGA